ncbi:uncharacterized protein LOC114525795 isoform X2 [Dendronephthya gigantea]|nr:uncharacterized protein LOC114525795 isoform X2 [Dendronephthya gigantea]XP_028403025.1 uncharacterized protein LOC114525795 isoform X2 [Dendronephthya gigantea]
MVNSIVSSLINFQFEESPKWRKAPSMTMERMVKEIVKFQEKWEKHQEHFDKKTVQKALLQSQIRYIYHLNTGEDLQSGTTSAAIESSIKVLNISLGYPLPIQSVSKQETETINVLKAHKFLQEEVKNNQDYGLHGLLAVTLIQDAHKLILKDLPLCKNYTKPGVFSEIERYVEYREELYRYKNPENMEESVQTLLDRYNDLMTHCVKEEKNLELRVRNMFKTCGWLLFELLDLHPFSDGNGRLCRLLCSYALSSMTPFPTQVYDVWSESKKEEYLDALVATRKSETRHPASLTSMLIERNYYEWKNFFSILEGET